MTMVPDKSPVGDAAESELALAAIGLEAEFGLVVNGTPRRVEDVFASPLSFIRTPLPHRIGSSYQLPNGGAVYFDTGVIEVATPPVEIVRGCAVRAVRSLWESIAFVRQHLTAWEEQSGNRAALVGFSAHYNVTFHAHEAVPGCTPERLALLLAHILPVPVMLLAANRASTGVGVRPRANRIEVTADFTPDPALAIATATLVTGITRAVMRWPSCALDMLNQRRIPIIRGFHPMPHTSRRGWLARFDCFPQNPFETDLDERRWSVINVRADDRGNAATLSLRQIARRIGRQFRGAVGRVADPFTLRFIEDVFAGREQSLLDLAARPRAYEDVGRLCTWDQRMTLGVSGRSRYERVLLCAMSGATLRLGRHVLTPVGMSGWSRVVFRRQDTLTTHVVPLDVLLPHLEEWEKPG